MKLNDTPRLGQADPSLIREFREHAKQVNGLSEGRLSATYNAQPAAPTTGDYAKGDFVRNSNPVALSDAGTSYFVDGWKCLSASPLTFAEVRIITSNIASSGGGGSVAWGSITGTLSSQTDLNSALAGKETAGAAATVQGNLNSHTGNTSNPHSTTKAQVGLGNVDNTSDANKPVSTAQAAADSAVQAFAIQRANHTGTQLAATISDFNAAVAATPAVTANTAKVSNATHTGDVTGSTTLTLATVNSNVGTFGSSSSIPVITVNAKGLVTAVTTATPSGGGSDPWTYVKLSSDFVTSSATAVNVTGLGFTPAANKQYEIRGNFLLRTATATVGPRPGVAWPTGLTDGIVTMLTTSSATANLTTNGNNGAAVLVAVGGLPNTTQSWPGSLEASIIAGGTPSGSFRIQLASETAGTNVTMKAGSFIAYREI